MLADVLGVLERSRAYRAARSIIEHLDKHAATRAASAMAFDAFLSLIPLAAFAGYLLSKMHRGSELILEIVRAAPPDVAKMVTEEFLRLSESPAIAPISVTGFLWVSSAGVATAMGVLETIYNARERSWYVRRAIAAACVLATLAMVPLVAGLGVLMIMLSGSIGARLVGLTLPGALVVLFVAGFFRISIQRPNIERRRIFPGAVLTVVLWAIVSTVFSFYVARLARYATFYGSLATVAIFLFWLWLLSLALLIGAELNARLERERAGTTSLIPPSIWAPSSSGLVPRSPALPREAAEILEEEPQEPLEDLPQGAAPVPAGRRASDHAPKERDLRKIKIAR